MRIFLPLVLVACSSNVSVTDPVTKKPAPVWNAPSGPIPIGQGQTTLLPYSIQSATAVTVEVASPAGVDVDVASDHLSIHVDYTVSGSVDVPVTLRDSDLRGTNGSVTLHLSVAPIGWKGNPTWTTPQGPDAREHGAFIVDDATGTALMVGGTGYKPQGTPLEDAWSLKISDSSWTPWKPKGDAIPGAGSRRVAVIPGSATAYAFGGYTAASNLDDLYKIAFGNGDATFTKLAVTGPEARELHVFAYDAGKQRFVLFGGYGTSVLNDTWLLSTGSTPQWQKVMTPTKPTGRYGSFYAMDQVNHRLLVFSGGQTPKNKDPVNAAADTWALDLSQDAPTWSPLAVTGTSPPGRRNGCFVFDPSGPRMLVWGGTADQATTTPGLWFLDMRPGKESWARVDRPGEPPLRSSSFGFIDGRGNLTCGFGNDADLYRDLAIIGY